ncbi:non-ribosomal peptide synthetase [Tumebacillus sp. BK434]|uniref:non-ribosomal peptide synthetase n=1 Tax=Tumebacillus sp. BK434 TaxID=2512169 RepID=UPI00104AF71E|nr:non-ribosomal peptide synthetase [Tumebacillus sp. BK434]
MVDNRVNFATLVELLQTRAQSWGDRDAFAFLGDDGEERITYAELDRKARAVGAVLQSLGAEGERALLLYQPGLDYIIAFFGCLYAGVFAIPAYPPRQNGNLDRLQAIVKDSEAKYALTSSAILSGVEKRFGDTNTLSDLAWVNSDEVLDAEADKWQQPEIGPQTLAFLQYTSGSTSAPKGVMLTHGNLLSNLELIKSSFETSEADRCVIWLPPYHDMGLIGGILQPLYAGFYTTLMAPVAFVQRPLRWLQEISRTKATVSGGPNFAYELCLDKITPEQRDLLDLSHWSVAFTGAEPIRQETLDRFAEYFAPCGFKKEAFYPCYGLAEGTLFVTGGKKTELPIANSFDGEELEHNRAIIVTEELEGTRTLVSSGRSPQAQKVRVVDHETFTVCGEEQVGEIWVSGPSVAQGYWNRPEQTQATFGAMIPETGEGPFLRTGDLGFLKDGELYVTGRMKDLIIIRGRNHYPQDIEFTVQECHPAIATGNLAAFSVLIDEEERLVITAEVERSMRRSNLDEVVATVRQAVAEAHELQVYGVVLLKPASIPKTSSGKIQRHACKDRFQHGGLEVLKSDVLDRTVANAEGEEASDVQLSRADLLAVAGEARSARLEQFLLARAAEALKVSPASVGRDKPLGALGMDSLTAVELKHEIEESLGVDLPLAVLLEGPSVATLTQGVLQELDEAAEVQADSKPMTPGEYPLSHGQRALYFLQQLNPNSAAYHIASAVQIGAGLDVAKLRAALATLVLRHPLLRTTFAYNGGEPLQVVHAALEVPMTVADSAAWSDVQVQTDMSGRVNESFDLEKGPLLRVNLYPRQGGEHVLLLAMHHIIVDFWSLGVIVQELSALYGGQELPAAGTAYADFAGWQTELLNGKAGAAALDYWQQELAGELPVLNLPTDNPRPSAQSTIGATLSRKLSPALTASVKQAAQAHGTTVFTTLLAAYQVLLHRYSGQDDILVGTPTAGRGKARYADTVGYFVNPVVVRGDLSANPTFAELLQAATQKVRGALAHQDYPFPLLVEKLAPKRDQSYSPIFQAMFVLQKSHLDQDALTGFALNDSGAEMLLGDLPLQAWALERRAAQFDITLMMAEVNGQLVASFEYDLGLFDSATIERMAAHYEILLAALVSQPALAVGEVSMLPAAERERLLVEWNRTAVDFGADGALHRLFEAQAARTPDAVAVVVEDRRLTYRELNEAANRLAHLLQRSGVAADVFVGVCMERSPEMVVSLLATLKAGGAYVPLDPSYPQERLRFILEDAQPPVLLTQAHLQELLPADAGEVLLVDREDISGEIAENLTASVTSDNLAYVIFTSGSTGRPKGAMLPHRAICNHMLWMLREFGIGEQDRVLQKTPFGFDASVWEFWAPLLAGGQLVLAKPGGHQDPVYLAEAVKAHGITLMQLVPSLLTLMLNGKLLSGADTLRHVFAGGEVLSPRDATEMFYQLPNAQLVNLYGPTEACIDTTSWRVVFDPHADPEVEEWVQLSHFWQQPIPIGRPIANAQVFLLDAHLNPVPTGVAGELHIGGAGLARGYVGRPDLTAEKFIDTQYGRLYKTGDLARWLADGTLDFLGRIDDQVKVRGFRIELGEIEAVLLRHEGVQEAVVIAREDALGDQRLVAYVVAAGELAALDLRDFAQRILPDYMVPSAYVQLEAFPLLPNGKVNRRALPRPEATQPGEYVAPRNEVESTLAWIFSLLLGAPQVGITDNFFDLGGHSLLAIQAVARISDILQVQLDLRTLFEHPTVERLAQQIERMERKALPPIRKADRTGHLPLSFAQERLWFFEELQGGTAAYNIPGGLRLRGSLDIAALEQSLNLILTRHEALRTSFATVDGQPKQVIADAAKVPFAVIDLLGLPEADREMEAVRIMNEEARKPFTLSEVPLVRANLLRMGNEDHILLLTLHHIVADGWSLGILMRHLTWFYLALTQGNLLPDFELPIQYADYAQWQKGLGPVIDGQLGYWKQQLGGELTVLQLPTDKPRPAVKTYNGASRALTLGQRLSEAVNRLAQQSGVTLYMTLLAAFQSLLYRYTGQDDILVGSPAAGRNRVEVSDLIGFFVNTLVMRTRLNEGELTFQELLLRVRDTSIDAFANQDVPFEMLLDELQPERNMSQTPLFQVMFALQNAPFDLTMPGLETKLLEGDSGTAKFDLTLQATETERGIELKLEYNTDLYEAATIDRMLGHYATLLQGAVAAPDQKLKALPLLTDAEEQQQLVEWNRTAADYPSDATLHSLFEAWVEQQPETVAVVCGDSRLTYAELNARANRLAHALQKQGVGPDAFVGICLERSPELLVAIFGTLKAGGAYVPLDPAHPKDRLRFILDDAKPSVLLTQASLLEIFAGAGVPTLLLDSTGEAFANESAANPPQAVTPDRLSYMLYTSGTTGLPKGALLQHRGVVNMLHDFITRKQVEPGAPFALWANYGFDLSVLEMFTCFMDGGSLHIMPDEFRSDSLAYFRWLEEHSIECGFIAPFMVKDFIQWLDEQPRKICLQRILIGVEPVLEPLVAELVQRLPELLVINGYGPTEASICATLYTFDPAMVSERNLPIGRAVQNTELYIFDPHQQLVPVGVTGELYVGGTGLARGYLNRAELNAERFVPHPFKPGERLYRTGDVVRYLPDGNIEYVSRIDHQVKVRGYRIELGEIEAVLTQHPKVLQTVVLARADGGDKYIAAYIVPQGDEAPTSAELRRDLKDKLPIYMIPSAFVMLDAIPLTTNGKVDRKALPEPVMSRTVEYVAPRTPAEAKMADIWAEVLGVEKVGIHDNFFDLGGHSLLATQLVTRVRTAFSVELPVRSLFEVATIAELGAMVESLQQKEAAAPPQPELKKLNRQARKL